MFDWLRRLLCPKQRELDLLRRENKLLHEDIVYEVLRRQLAELKLELALDRKEFKEKTEFNNNDHI